MPDNAPTLISEKPFPERWREWFTVIGSIAGIAALLWNVYWTTSNARGSYVQLALEIRSADTTNGPHPTALTTIENKGELSKIIDYAALVISPAQKDIRNIVDELRHCSGDATAVNVLAEPTSTVLAYLPGPDAPLYCNDEVSMIPLPFFYKEQKTIGNERLSSRMLVDVNAFRHPGGATPSPAYDVRFIVRGEGRTRSTLDLPWR